MEWLTAGIYPDSISTKTSPQNIDANVTIYTPATNHTHQAAREREREREQSGKNIITHL